MPNNTVTLTTIQSDPLTHRLYTKWHNQRKELRTLINNRGDAESMLILMGKVKRTEDWFADIHGVNICALMV